MRQFFFIVQHALATLSPRMFFSSGLTTEQRQQLAGKRAIAGLRKQSLQVQGDHEVSAASASTAPQETTEVARPHRVQVTPRFD